MSTKLHNGKYYDDKNPFKFHSSEIEQGLLYTEINDDEKYRLWNKYNKDLTLFNKKLTGYLVPNAKTYVNKGESLITKLDDDMRYSELDILDGIRNTDNENIPNLNLFLSNEINKTWVKIGQIIFNSAINTISKDITLIDINNGATLSFRFSLKPSQNSPISDHSSMEIYRKSEHISINQDDIKIIAKSTSKAELWIDIKNSHTNYKIFENNSYIYKLNNFVYDTLTKETNEPIPENLGANIPNKLNSLGLTYSGNIVYHKGNSNNSSSNWETKDLITHGDVELSNTTLKDTLTIDTNNKIVHNTLNVDNILRQIGSSDNFIEKYNPELDTNINFENFWSLTYGNSNKGIRLDNEGRLDANKLSENGTNIEDIYALKSSLTNYDKAYNNISKIKVNDNTYLETSYTDDNNADVGKYLIYKDIDDSLKKIKSGDSDKLSGQTADYFLNADNISSGTLSNSRISQGQLPNNSVELGGENLDTITVPGYYRQRAGFLASSSNNYPINLTGTLIVLPTSGGNAVKQLYMSFDNTGLWSRGTTIDGWTTWAEINTSTNSNLDTIDWKARDLYESGVKISDKYLQITNANTDTIDWRAKDVYEEGVKLENKYIKIINGNNDTTDWRAKDLYENGVKLSDKYLGISGSGLNTSDWNTSFSNMGKLYSDKTSQYEQVSISNTSSTTDIDSYITYKNGTEYIKLRSGYSDNSGKLNDQDSSYYLNADNINTGKLENIHLEDSSIPFNSKTLVDIDLNDEKIPGYYNINSINATTDKHFPKMNSNGSLEILKENNNILQTYKTISNEIFTRTYNGVWSDWMEQYNNENSNNDTTDWRARKLYESGTSIEEKYANKNGDRNQSFFGKIGLFTAETTGQATRIYGDRIICAKDDDGSLLNLGLNNTKTILANTDGTLEAKGLHSANYISGIGGKGTYNISTNSEMDNLSVRESLKVNTFVNNNINIQNGDMTVSDSATITYVHDSQHSYFENPHPFTVGMDLRCQQLDGLNVNVYYLKVQSTGYTEGFGYWIGYAVSGTGEPQIGDLLTRSSGDLLYLNSSDTIDGTYFDVLEDGVTKIRLGNISAINDPIFGQLSGQGGYLENFYGKGDVILGNKSSIDFANVNNVKIGGTNLALNSAIPISSTGYLANTYNVSEPWIEGQEYALTIKGNPTGSNKFGIWFNNGTISGGIGVEVSDGLWEVKFSGLSIYTQDFRIYNFPSSTSGAFNIDWVKLEKGTVGTDWSPSPNDKANINGDTNKHFYGNAIIAKSLRSGDADVRSTEVRDDKIFNWTYGVGYHDLGLNNGNTIKAKDNGELEASSFKLSTYENSLSMTAGYLTIKSRGNEMCIGGSNSASDMHVNYRLPVGTTKAPKTWYIRDGHPDGWADVQMGLLTASSANLRGRILIDASVAGDGGWDNCGLLLRNNNSTAGEAAVSFQNSTTGSNYWINGLNQSSVMKWGYGTNFEDGKVKMSLNVAGDLTVTREMHATNFILSSDIRLKTDITPIYTDNIENIKAVNYKFISDKENKTLNGYIAQDVEKINKSLVREDEKGELSLDYIGIHTAKISRLEDITKKQSQEISKLKELIKKLTTK